MLARFTGEADTASGDVTAALAAFRRALAFEPAAPDLLTRVDDLLKDQGDPRDRIALHRAALQRGADARATKELLHRIATIERYDLRDLEAAIGTYEGA